MLSDKEVAAIEGLADWNPDHPMVKFCEISDCRRAHLLRYFDEEPDFKKCGNCDACLSPRPEFDGTIAAQKIMSAIYWINRDNERDFGFGLGHVIEVLMGANTQKIRDWGHDEIRTFGAGKDDFQKHQWRDIARQLINQGLVAIEAGKFPVVTLTAKGVDFLRDSSFLSLTELPVARRESSGSSRSGKGSAGAAEVYPVGGADEELLDQLRAMRTAIALQKGVPPYVVFHDKALRMMAVTKPRTDDEFLGVDGVGPHKLEQYGEEMMGCIGEFVGAVDAG